MTTTLAYDADGNRVRVLYPGTGGDIYTPFPDVEKAIAGGVTTWRITFSAAGQMVAQRVTAGATVTLYSLHADRLGSVVAVGNAGGGLVGGSYAAYEPFGTFLVPPTGTNPSVTDRGFTGQRSNNLSPAWLGLVYMNARYYHPQLGRFVSPDTIVPEPGEPQSFNRYAYVRNSPLNFIDPTGHRECQEPNGGCNPYVPPWITAAENYRVGQDIVFGPNGAQPPQTYGQLSLGPLNIVLDAAEPILLDINIEIGIGGYFFVGGGVSKEFSFGDRHFDGPTSLEIGKGIGLEIIGIGLEYKKALEYSSDGTISTGHYFTGLVLSVGDGILIDSNSVVIRPSEQLAEVLAQGQEGPWLALFDKAYSSGVVSTDMDYLGSIATDDSLNVEVLVPVYLATTSILTRR